jgi:L-2-hydroxycarboxylate dehydrogenase (NAD+)
MPPDVFAPEGDLLVPIDRLQAFGERLLAIMGVPEADARLTVETLIEADLRGVESHGMAHIVDFYVRRFQHGHINPTPDIRIVSDAPAAAVMDADRALGFIACHRAMDLAMDKARKCGVAFVSIKNSTHCGAGQHYALKAARAGMVGISVTTGGNIVIPPGGTKRTYGSNVLSSCAPTGRGFYFCLDGATSVVAGGKFEIAKRRGKPAKLGWGLDHHGRPTDNPNDYFSGGGILPLGSSPETGAYKGFGYSIFADVLSGVLSGMGASLTMPRDGSAAHMMAAIQVESFIPFDDFIEHMNTMVDGLKGAERQPGVDEITIPGEPEMRMETARRQAGAVPLHASIVRGFREAAEELGVEYGLGDDLQQVH